MRAAAMALLLAACSSSKRPAPPDACYGVTPDAPLPDSCCELDDLEAQRCFASKTFGCHVFTCSVCPLRRFDTCPMAR